MFPPAADPAPPLVLQPGDVACDLRGTRFETLLGSCIAVVLTDPARTVGAICHIVHPAPAPAPRAHDTHYADGALAAMAHALRQHGMQPNRCEAYVIGGANMFPGIYPPFSVGERNASQIVTTLTEAGVRVLQVDVGGTAYRRLRWTVGPDAPTVIPVPL